MGRASERQRPIGSGYAYSDLNYILLGEVVQMIAGKSVAEATLPYRGSHCTSRRAVDKV